MAEKLSLRDRRRLETEQEIRRATLRLCLTHGYEAVTTEMISAEAGISPRTFFNYFANKEAALIARDEDIDDQSLDCFRFGPGTIVDGFMHLLRQHLEARPPDREILRGLFQLLETTPHLELAFVQSMRKMHTVTAASLRDRLGPGSAALADLIAATLTHSVLSAMTQWVADDAATLEELLADVRRLLKDLSVELGRPTA